MSTPAGPGGRVAAAARVLAGAGVASPRHDAEVLAAHVLGVPRAALPGVRAVPGEEFDVLVARRAGREPLQHLLGRAPFRRLELAVGPGVFVPRPETELVVEPVLDHLGAPGVCVDLCAGSGALGLSVALERPGSEVHLVESSPRAYRWLAANAAELAGRPAPRAYLADATGAAAPDGVLAALSGRVDAVVVNPPYLPERLRSGLQPEVRDWDPPEALFAGADGLALARRLLPTAARLLRPGGLLSMEHGDAQQDLLLDLLVAAGWSQAVGHLDLAGHPRFVTAVRG